MRGSEVDMNVPVIDIEATSCRIREARCRTGLSVDEVRQVFGMTNPQSIYKWEEGRCLPTVDNIVILAKLYGVKVDDLIAVRK